MKKGRPKMKASLKLSEKIGLRLTPDEKRRVVAARKPGETLAAASRRLLQVVLLRAETCEWEGCERPAITHAWDRLARRLYAACDTHGSMIADLDSPEYTDSCPACSCRFGVN